MRGSISVARPLCPKKSRPVRGGYDLRFRCCGISLEAYSPVEFVDIPGELLMSCFQYFHIIRIQSRELHLAPAFVQQFYLLPDLGDGRHTADVPFLRFKQSIHQY